MLSAFSLCNSINVLNPLPQFSTYRQRHTHITHLIYTIYLHSNSKKIINCAVFKAKQKKKNYRSWKVHFCGISSSKAASSFSPPLSTCRKSTLTNTNTTISTMTSTSFADTAESSAPRRRPALTPITRIPVGIHAKSWPSSWTPKPTRRSLKRTDARSVSNGSPLPCDVSKYT